MRYGLRTLLTALAVAPIGMALVWTRPDVAVIAGLAVACLAAIVMWPRIYDKGG